MKVKEYDYHTDEYGDEFATRRDYENLESDFKEWKDAHASIKLELEKMQGMYISMRAEMNNQSEAADEWAQKFWKLESEVKDYKLVCAAIYLSYPIPSDEPPYEKLRDAWKLGQKLHNEIFNETR